MTSLLIASGVTVGTAVTGAASANGELETVVVEDIALMLTEIGCLTTALVQFQVDLAAAISASASVQAQLSAQLNINVGILATLALGPLGLFVQMELQLLSPQFLLGLELALPDFLASLTASLSIGISLSAGLAVQAGFAAALVLDVTASILLLTTCMGELVLRLPILNAALNFQTTLANILATSGVVIYTYAGPLSSLASDLGSYINAGNTGGLSLPDVCNAVVFVTQSSGTWTAMSQVLKTA